MNWAVVWVLRGKLNNSEEDKIWQENEEEKRQEDVGGILPRIREEDGEESVCGEQASCFETQGETAISDNFWKYGDRGNLEEQRWAILTKRG